MDALNLMGVNERNARIDVCRTMRECGKSYTEIGDAYGVSATTAKNWCEGYTWLTDNEFLRQYSTAVANALRRSGIDSAQKFKQAVKDGSINRVRGLGERGLVELGIIEPRAQWVYPCAIVTAKGIEKPFFQTTYASNTREKAQESFDIWEKDYHYELLATWIQDMKGGISDMKVRVGTLG